MLPKTAGGETKNIFGLFCPNQKNLMYKLRLKSQMVHTGQSFKDICYDDVKYFRVGYNNDPPHVEVDSKTGLMPSRDIFYLMSDLISFDDT